MSECGAFQTSAKNAAWYARWNPTNPHSPLNVHKVGSTVSVQVKDLTFFKHSSGLRDLAQVRYRTVERQDSGAVERVGHWIATIRFAYGKPPSNPRQRLWNPLGFKVVSFTREPEVLGEGVQPAVSPAGTGAGLSSALASSKGQTRGLDSGGVGEGRAVLTPVGPGYGTEAMSARSGAVGCQCLCAFERLGAAESPGRLGARAGGRGSAHPGCPIQS